MKNFTRDELLNNGWTKENLIELSHGYKEALAKANGKNPAAIVRRKQALQLARKFF